MSQIDTILFDIGNVLVRFDFHRAANTLLGRCRAASSEDILTKLIPLRDHLETGKYTNEDFLTRLSQTLEFTGSPEELAQIYKSLFTPILPTWDLVKELLQRYRICLLSNTSDLHLQGLRRDYPIFTYFEQGTYSHLAGALKPESPIFETAIQELNLRPESTSYLDDMKANVEAGALFGLQSHCYAEERHEECLDFLTSSGVSIGTE